MIKRIQCNYCFNNKEWLVGQKEPKWLKRKIWIACGKLVINDNIKNAKTIVVKIIGNFCCLDCFKKYKLNEKELLKNSVNGNSKEFKNSSCFCVGVKE